LTKNVEKVSDIDACVTFISEAADEKLASDINVYHVVDGWVLTDYVIVMSVKNEIHCRAVLLALDGAIREQVSREADDFYVPPKLTGKPESGWVIIDLNSILIHIMLVELRDYYDLDKVLEEKADTVDHT